MTDIRKEFEAWYASKWDFEHPDFAMQTMWFAYQAAAESRDARIAELRDSNVDLMQSCAQLGDEVAELQAKLANYETLKAHGHSAIFECDQCLDDNGKRDWLLAFRMPRSLRAGADVDKMMQALRGEG